VRASLVVQFATKRIARAWLDREQPRDILDRKQVNIVSGAQTSCAVPAMIRTHFDGIVAWTRSHQTKGFIEAINGLISP
jgi:hypothetical protein